MTRVEFRQELTGDDDRDRAEHANVCSLPFGHEGGHWWDESTATIPERQRGAER